uniref:Cadherin domain-containing protein n=1 Tax=Macrostomum lignano TaxID=282301 RepID=A0A1I8JPR4_9PLAT
MPKPKLPNCPPPFRHTHTPGIMLIPALLCLLRLAVVAVEGGAAACQFTTHVSSREEEGGAGRHAGRAQPVHRLPQAATRAGRQPDAHPAERLRPGWELASQLVLADPEGRLRLNQRIDRDNAEDALSEPAGVPQPGHRHPVGARPSGTKMTNAPTFCSAAHAPLEVTENVNDQTLQLPGRDRPGRAGLNGATLTRIVDRLSRADTAQPPQLLVVRGWTMRNCAATTSRWRPATEPHNGFATPPLCSPGRERQLAEVQPARVPPRTRVRVRLQIWPAVLVDRLKATDADDGENGRLVYSIVPPGGEAFDIGADGDLFLRRHAVERHRAVIIDVLDVNDHAPEMSLQARSAAPRPSAKTSSTAGSPFCASLTATSGDNGRVDCRLAEGGDRFRGGDLRAELHAAVRSRGTGAGLTDRRVLDHGEPRRTVNKTFAIDIEDVNEHAPEFPDMIVYDRQVPEQLENEFVAKVTATDADATANITYRLADECLDKGHFQGGRRHRHHPHSGAELSQVCVLTIEASDGLHTSSTRVNVKIVDINDNPPPAGRAQHADRQRDLCSHFAAFIRHRPARLHGPRPAEHRQHRTKLPAAQDSAQSAWTQPQLHCGTGRPSLRPRVLDREAAPQHLLMETTATVTVRLRDLNDKSATNSGGPHRTSSFNITDQQPVGATVTQATDADDCEPSESAIDCLRRGSLHLRLRQRVRLFENRPRAAASCGWPTHWRPPAPAEPGRHGHRGAAAAHACSCRRLGRTGWEPAGAPANNWTVLLIIVVASSFITVVLVVAIVLLNRRQPCFLGSSSGSGGGGGGGGGGRGGDRRRRSKGGGRQAEAPAAAAGGDARPTSRHGRWAAAAAAAAGGGGSTGSFPTDGGGSRRQLLTTFGHQPTPDGGTLRIRETFKRRAGRNAGPTNGARRL